MKASYVFNFEDVMTDITSHFKKIDTNQYRTFGATPIIDQSAKDFCGYTDIEPEVDLVTPPYIVFGDHTRRFKFVDVDFVLGADGTKVLKAKVDADHKYLFHFLNSIKLEEAGYSRHYKYLKRTKLFVPPLAEQQRIAALLDTADHIIKQRELAIAKLDQLAQSVFLDMFGSTKENPKKFPIKKLKEIIKFEGGSQPPASTFSDTELEGFIRLVQIRDFRTDRYKTYIPKHLAKRFFNFDDVMIGRYGPPVFQIFRGLSGSYNVALMKANPTEWVSKDFVYYLLQEKYLHSFVVANSERTAGQSGVNLELLENYTAYLPPIDLQKKFSAAIFQYQKLKLNLFKSNHELRLLYSSLQHQSFAVN